MSKLVFMARDLKLPQDKFQDSGSCSVWTFAWFDGHFRQVKQQPFQTLSYFLQRPMSHRFNSRNHHQVPLFFAAFSVDKPSPSASGATRLFITSDNRLAHASPSAMAFLTCHKALASCATSHFRKQQLHLPTTAVQDHHPAAGHASRGRLVIRYRTVSPRQTSVGSADTRTRFHHHISTSARQCRRPASPW